MASDGNRYLMLEMLVIGVILVMAGKTPRRRKKFRRYIRGNIDENLSLGTLAAGTLVGVAFDETVNERTFVSSVVCSWSLSNWTAGDDDGPIVVGLAHGDYSDAEIEAYIENTGSWNEGDLVQSREVGRRLIKRVGQFMVTDIQAETIHTLNNGMPVKTKLNWVLNQGATLKYWAYNQGASALATTDPDVRIQGHANLWPT